MTDEEIIRRAVELAPDCFAIKPWHDGVFRFVMYAPGWDPVVNFTDDLNDLPQWFLDALAAQLVRQVDAIHPEMLDIWYDMTRIRTGKERFFAEGKDRTMNTLRAIVESGVLK